MLNEIYENCPILKSKEVTLRKVMLKDSNQLLKCYSDLKSVPLFNSDNCNGDDFYYKTIERMEEALKFWEWAYEHKCFIRWSVLSNNTKEIIGTVEMFHEESEEVYGAYGVLRVDLISSFEKEKYIDNVLELANENFYNLFEVDFIFTKAIKDAKVRRDSLEKNGYVEMKETFKTYEDYYVRKMDIKK